MARLRPRSNLKIAPAAASPPPSPSPVYVCSILVSKISEFGVIAPGKTTINCTVYNNLSIYIYPTAKRTGTYMYEGVLCCFVDSKVLLWRGQSADNEPAQ